jgi:Domain of unknown function (DUF4124)
MVSKQLDNCSGTTGEPDPSRATKINCMLTIATVTRLKSSRGLTLATAFVFFATVSIANAQVYKCADSNGKTTYSDAPCDSRTKPLKLPNGADGKATDANMCAQLLDETRRLDAEADRDAKRGRAERSDSAKRRQALTKQYQARCIGIARSRSSPK